MHCLLLILFRKRREWHPFLLNIMFTYEPLFGCPIYKVKIDPSSYDKEQIVSNIKHNYSLNKYRNSSLTGDECNIHHSHRDFENDDFTPINYDKLQAVYDNIAKQFLTEVYPIKRGYGWKCTIINYTCITNGQWLVKHNHLPHDDFATAHYLRLTAGHTPTRFFNPADFASYVKDIQPTLFNKLDSTDPINSFMFEKWVPQAEEDDMFIFPAAMQHDIPLQTSEDFRITISSNIEINA